MNKQQVFAEELSWIVDPQIKQFAVKLVDCAPDYFFSVAASSTGKYHPAYALGPGGLVRHTKAAAKLMHELTQLEMFGKYSQEQKDMMLTAIVAHDFFKHGLADSAGAFTAAEHPLVCANYIKGNQELCALLPADKIEFICDCIASHMGQWNTDYRSKEEILPKPQTGPQNLVHLCDYLASRKYLIMDFGDAEYRPSTAETAPTATEEEKKTDPELDDKIAQLVGLCKQKIAEGVPNTDIYAIIAQANGGNRNPNSIKDIKVADDLLKKLEETHV